MRILILFLLLAGCGDGGGDTTSTGAGQGQTIRYGAMEKLNRVLSDSEWSEYYHAIILDIQVWQIHHDDWGAWASADGRTMHIADTSIRDLDDRTLDGLIAHEAGHIAKGIVTGDITGEPDAKACTQLLLLRREISGHCYIFDAMKILNGA